MNTERESGLDIVRCFAIVSLPFLHCFIWAGLYSVRPQEISVVLYVLMFSLRWVVYCVVPLFMTLTGYLNGSMKMEKAYLKKILPVLFSYVIISAIAYLSIADIVEKGLADMLIALFNYTANPYSWYVEMYIGLFLLAPFLNILWKVLNTKQRKYLIMILVIITFATQANSLFKYQDNYVKFFPAWWVGIYPLCYFFIGKWIKEYKPHPRKSKLLAALAVIAICEGIMTWLFATEDGFSYSGWMGVDSYCSITCALMSTLLFILLYDIRAGSFIQKIVTHISKISFEVYLFTYITDNFIWKKYNEGNYMGGGGSIKGMYMVACTLISLAMAILFAELLCGVKRFVFRIHK